MDEKKYEWDDNKNQSNGIKHTISFERATKIFEDPDKITFESTSKDYGESRYLVVGLIFEVLYTVVYTLRNSFIRIISARRANEKETKIYHEAKNQKYGNKI